MNYTGKRVLSLQVGRPQPVAIGGRDVMTAFGKTSQAGKRLLGRTGFDGDEQADKDNHGGPDKAVCVYCYEHYAYWENELGSKLTYGAFGENITVTGMPETDVRIGDTYRLGEAVVQISQPRQPCYKLAARHGRDDLPELVQQTGLSGYYFRVQQTGFVTAGDRLELLEADPLGVTIAYCNQIKYREKEDAQGLRRILSVAALSDSWRASLESRLAGLDNKALGTNDNV